MKVVGTFDPNVLYQQKAEKRNTCFAAMLAFNLDRKPGEQDVTALFASNHAELGRLYEQTTGKDFDEKENGSNVFVFWNQVTIQANNYWSGEFLDDSKDPADEEFIPAGFIPSNRNMKHYIQ